MKTKQSVKQRLQRLLIPCSLCYTGELKGRLWTRWTSRHTGGATSEQQSCICEISTGSVKKVGRSAMFLPRKQREPNYCGHCCCTILPGMSSLGVGLFLSDLVRQPYFSRAWVLLRFSALFREVRWLCGHSRHAIVINWLNQLYFLAATNFADNCMYRECWLDECRVDQVSCSCQRVFSSCNVAGLCYSRRLLNSK